MENNYVVIMAGGIGSRFWPFSRTKHPKQFHDVLGMGKTLMQLTAERFEGVCPRENIYIVTNKMYKGLVKEQLPFLSDHQILLEPTARNTAPCVAYAAYKIMNQNPKANLVIAPADHIILDTTEFRNRISIALSAASTQDILITLGINPSRPDTGYGYIQYLEDESTDVKKVKTFTEKPHLELAEKFLDSGDFVWNAGIFVWSAKSIVYAFMKHLPEVAELFKGLADDYYTDDEQEEIDKVYSLCKNISIDFGIMEKADNVYVVLSDFGWSDLGTWKSLFEIKEKNEEDNVLDGNIMVYNTHNSIIKTPKERLVVVEGLDNFIVAEYDNVLMICNKDKEQMVKNFVADVKAKKNNEKFY